MHTGQIKSQNSRGASRSRWLLAATLALLLAITSSAAHGAGTVPGAPTDLTAVADTNANPQAAIALTWTPSASDGGSQITGHQYRWKAGEGNWWTEWTDIPDSEPTGANAASYTVTGLLHPNPPQVYTFEVRAKNANGPGTASSQASDTFDAPAAIAELRTTAGDQKVRVQWDTPENNGREITHYQYSVFATRPGESTHTVVWPQKLPGSDGDTTSADISGLTNGLPHIIGIAAVNAVGVTPPTWKTGLVPTAKPGPPRNLAAEPGGQAVTLSWTAPESDGGAAVTGYSFQQKAGAAGFGDWTQVPGSDVTTRDHTATGLTNGVVHSFRVRAGNDQGEGSASGEASATPTSVPSEPQDLTATAGNAVTTLNWTSPASSGGLTITGYQYRHQAGGEPFTAWADLPGSNVNTSTAVFTELTNGAAYTFQIRAKTAGNKGAAAQANSVPEADPPAAPRSLSALNHDQSVELRWEAPVSNGGSPLVRHEYRQQSGDSAFGEWTAVPDSGAGQNNALGYTVTGLTNGARYTFLVRAVNNAAEGEASNQASHTPQVISAPGKPRDYRLSSGDGEVVLQWTKPARDGGRPILGYEYCMPSAGTCGSEDWQAVPTTATDAAGQGLLGVPTSNGTYIRAKLRALNSRGASPQADGAAVAINGAPNAPTGLSAAALSSTQIRISWTEPQDQAGTTVLSYTLESSRDGVRWSDSSQATGSTSAIDNVGEDATVHYRISTRFRTDSPLIISGADFSAASSPSGPTVSADTGAEATTAEPTIHVTDGYAHEGTGSKVIFHVSLAGPLAGGETVTVDYRTEDRTATAEDYTAQAGTLRFSAEDRHQRVSVTVLDDSLEDSGETFTLRLSNPSGAALARSGATGTIYNEETLITGFTLVDHASNSDPETLSGGQTITLGNPANGQYGFRANPEPDAAIGSVHIALSGATTDSRTDNDAPYTLHASGGQGLPPGAYTIQATVYPKPGGEGNAHQTLSVSFTIAAAAPAQASQLSAADAAASEEDDPTIDFVVTLSPASDETVTVDYATSDGTAAAGSDYTARSGTLTFSAGDTTRTVSVPIIDDAAVDDNETLTFTLSNPLGAEISGATATGAIGDRDEAAAEPTAEPLTAAFKNAPANHDGSAPFTLEVEFSEDVAISYVNMRDDSFTVTGGDVNEARRVNGRSDLWLITVEPDGGGDVGINLPANRACSATGAICTRGDNPRQLTNSPSETVPGPTQDIPGGNHAAAGAPTISGTPQVDETLTAGTSAISDEDGLANVSYRYQWLADDADIAGRTNSTHTLAFADQGRTIRVRVTFTDDAGFSETLTSAATAAVAAAPNREATGKPTIGGTPQVGETLTADTANIADQDRLDHVSYRYQWTAGGSDIDGATGSSHLLTANEQGQTIRVKVSFTDDRNNAETRTSEETGAVAAAQVPLTVSLRAAAPAAHDGSATFTFDMEFSENLPLSYATLRDHAFNVTNGKVRMARRADAPSNILWTIHIEPTGDAGVRIQLPATSNCSSMGAICTQDGRKLSNSLDFTVPRAP